MYGARSRISSNVGGLKIPNLFKPIKRAFNHLFSDVAHGVTSNIIQNILEAIDTMPNAADLGMLNCETRRVVNNAQQLRDRVQEPWNVTSYVHPPFPPTYSENTRPTTDEDAACLPSYNDKSGFPPSYEESLLPSYEQTTRDRNAQRPLRSA